MYRIVGIARQSFSIRRVIVRRLRHVAAAAFRYPALKPQTPSDRKVGGGYHLTKSDTVLSCQNLVVQHPFALGLTYRVRSSDCGGSTAVLNQTVRGVTV